MYLCSKIHITVFLKTRSCIQPKWFMMSHKHITHTTNILYKYFPIIFSRNNFFSTEGGMNVLLFTF